MYAYSSYTYTQDWKSVVLTFYLVKVFYVLLFYLDGGNHLDWFDGLGNLNVHDNVTNINHVDNSDDGIILMASVVVGDFIFLLMGMVLGKIQSVVINEKMFYSFVNGFKFKTVDAWKKHFEKAIEEKFSKRDTAPTKTHASRNFIESYGLWPLKRIFPFECACCCCCCYEADDDDDSSLAKSRDRMRWAHRRFYWFYFIQAVLLGTPATIVYNVDTNITVRTGAMVYYVFQIVLLTSFYFWNRRDHTSALNWYDENNNNDKPTRNFVLVRARRNKEKNDGADGLLTYEKTTVYTRFNAIYLCWLVTITVCSALVIFKTAVNVSLTVIGAWIFSLIVWFIVYSSHKIVEQFYSTFIYTLTSQSWLTVK